MLIKYVRDGLTEQEHDGFVLSYKQGFLSTSETDLPFYLRSCAKPLQAALLLKYNADNFFKLTLDEIALCAASHTGESYHIETAKSILKKTGLDRNLLKCGVCDPISEKAKTELLISGKSADILQNNCSGKHLMFLAVSKLNGWNLDDYDKISSPVQIKVRDMISTLCETDVSKYPMTTDGCGVPIVSMPLKNMLIGYLNLFLDSKYSAIKEAYLNYPLIIGGENRLDTVVIQSGNGNLVSKVGAGGLCIVVNLKERDAVVVKINDCSNVARKIATLETLKRLGWADINYDQNIRTLSGKSVGKILVELKI